MSWREVPIVGTVGVLVIDMVAFGGQFVLQLLVSLGDLIPILSLASAYVAPKLEWLPSSAISTALFVSALLYIGVSIARLIGGGGNND